MKLIIVLLTIALTTFSCTPNTDQQRMKSLLVQQLKNTHTNQDWFVPTKIAIEGITSKQSNWKDSTENHSIGELVSHITFWNERVLKIFNGDSVPDFKDNNKETFKKNNSHEWNNAVSKLDSVQTKWEQVVENATEDQILEWTTEIVNMTAHTAYHTGQIIYIRKQNGWWK